MKDIDAPENLYQKLAKIRKQVEVLQRNKDGYGYKYLTQDEILSRLTVLMDKYGISLIPGIVPGTTAVTPYTYRKTKMLKDGRTFEDVTNEILVTADTTWTWVNNDNPEERITVPWTMVGQQGDASQAMGSGLTYSNRYFLINYFNIATPNEDPDNFRSQQKKTEAAEDAIVAGEIVSQFDGEVRDFLASHEDRAEELKKFVNVYVKGGDYFKIKDSATAGRLLSGFREKFMVSNEPNGQNTKEE